MITNADVEQGVRDQGEELLISQYKSALLKAHSLNEQIAKKQRALRVLKDSAYSKCNPLSDTLNSYYISEKLVTEVDCV